MVQAVAKASSGLDKHAILGALRALRRGDFSVGLPQDLTGADGDIAEAFNDVVEFNRTMCEEMQRLRRAVGRDGQIGERGHLPNARGAWQRQRSEERRVGKEC